MSTVLPSLLAVCATAWCLQTQCVSAGSWEVSAQAKSGEPTRIRVFFDCRLHAPFWLNGAFVEHGSIVFKEATLRACGNANEPVRELWYTSNPGFKGVDKVVLPAGQGTGTIDVTVR
jgi:hypothetical protein